MALIALLFAIPLLTTVIHHIEAVPQKSNEVSKTPPSLYKASDNVAILTADNFNENVYNSTSAWLVQFYSSWCGHCIKFSPVWKTLAASVYNWRNVVAIGAVNCADDGNTDLCRSYEATKKPTVRYFPPLMNGFNKGVNSFKPRENHDPEIWRNGIIEHLQNSSTTVPSWPDLSPLDSNNVTSAWKGNDSRLLILTVEKKESYHGRYLILDLYSVKEIMVRYTFDVSLSNNSSQLPQIFAMRRENLTDVSKEEIPLTSASILNSVRDYLRNKGFEVPNDFKSQSGNESETFKNEQSAEQLALVNRVYMDDLESSVRYSLFQEVASQPNITDDAMDALKSYLRVVEKYFPSNARLHDSISSIALEIKDTRSMSGGDFKNLIEKSKNLSALKNENWVGCKGSVATYRRYPCSVWMLFHTLSVQAYVNPKLANGTGEVLTAMVGYIGNFFGCEECAEDFLEMSKTIAGNVTSTKDGVLWLWKAHNNANARLSGDFSEDPAFPKRQFPVESMCPKCRNSDGSWKEDEVLSYLVDMYSSNNIHETDKPSSSKATRLAYLALPVNGLNLGVNVILAFIYYFYWSR